MRLQETHPQRTEREFRGFETEFANIRRGQGDASNPGNPASRGVQGEKKPTREWVGFLVLVGPLGLEPRTKGL